MLSFIVFLLTLLILLTVISAFYFNHLKNKHVTEIRCVFTVTALTLGWIVYTGLMSGELYNSDFKQKTTFLIIPMLLIVIYVVISGSIFNVIKLIPGEYLIYIQSYRIFTELYFWLMYLSDNISPRITINGLNYDIFIGLSAPIVGYYTFSQNKWPHLVAVFWNIAGVLLVINIFLLSFGSGNNILFSFPHIWVIGFIVPFGLIVNLISLKVIVAKDFL